jgi:glutathione S-transferase
MLELVIANKNYSSWSMRPWVLLTELGLPFKERLLRFDFHRPDSRFAAEAARLSPTARVPVLVEADGFATWDSLAIAERLHELFPEAGVWPQDAASARPRPQPRGQHAQRLWRAAPALPDEHRHRPHRRGAAPAGHRSLAGAPTCGAWRRSGSRSWRRRAARC